MAETLYPSGPLDAYAASFAALPDGLSITAEPPAATAVLRLPLNAEKAEDADVAACALLGTALPREPNTWAATPEGRIIWLGPGEWLVTSATAVPEQLEADLREAVSAHGGAAMNVSAQRVSLRLSGRFARDLLSTGCSLDLHPAVFGVGRSAQTAVGQTGVVLLALDEGYRILVRSSFAGYLADWLLDASLEYTDDQDLETS